ncbi:MAG: response regulator [Lachnospiraceae bacterium]|nr:response regulator [Lachnospiraceae bacterium]
MAEDNKEIAVIMFHYSVIVKGIERKLTEMGYRATVIKDDLEQEVDRLAGRVSLMLFYLSPDCTDDMSVIRSLRNMSQMLAAKQQKMILIGEIKYKDDLMSNIGELKRYPWLDRPIDMDAFEKMVTIEITKADDMAKPARILIVDDDPAYAKIVREWIKDRYKVDIVTAGMQAILFLLKLPEGEKIDMILLDYEMPVVDGPQVLQMLRQESSLDAIPVIFLTGNGTREAVSRVMELKPDGYILKSTQKEELLKFLKEKLKK